MLYVSDKDVLIEQILIEPIVYRTTVCVEYTTKNNKYWEAMLKDVQIRQTNDFVSQLVCSMQVLLEEIGCASDNRDELDKVSSLHCLLEQYNKEWHG